MSLLTCVAADARVVVVPVLLVALALAVSERFPCLRFTAMMLGLNNSPSLSIKSWRLGWTWKDLGSMALASPSPMITNYHS
nr:uncharacterized protein CTRU02_04243 [Colletotrichum truncatum]KAF6796282.1 hypothetical protein CTRU02_04243 [Colletotrichum truncatum]